MESRFHIRDATPDDAAVMAAVYAMFNEADDVIYSAEAIRKYIAESTDREAFLLLEHKGDVGGWGRLKRYSNRLGYRFACETTLCLPQNQDGRDYESRLLPTLIDRSRVYGYRHIIAKVWATNRARIRVHQQCGFEIVGIQREIGYRDKRWQNIVVMQYLMEEVGIGET